MKIWEIINEDVTDKDQGPIEDESNGQSDEDNAEFNESSKYLGPTTKVKINKQGWQVPLNKKGFGS